MYCDIMCTYFLFLYCRPTSLWILNPGLLIQKLELDGTEQERLIQNRDGKNPSAYGSIGKYYINIIIIIIMCFYRRQYSIGGRILLGMS